jgi:hypothetical protein
MVEYDINSRDILNLARTLIYQAKIKVCDCDCPCNCLVIEGFESDIFAIRIVLDDRLVYLKVSSISEDDRRYCSN